MIRSRVLVAAVAAIVSVTATAAETARAREEAQPEVRPAARLDVRALFERAPGVITEGKNGVTAGPTVQVMLARVGPDGKLIRVCVDNEAAAQRFVDAPVETLQRGKAQQQ